MATSDFAIGPPLSAADFADAEALVREAGWNQVESDWRIFLDFGIVYAVRDAGRVVATAATLPYGGRFAWISMVLVAGDYRRRGLATRLLRHCIDDLTARNLVPVLDATPEGREVYRGLGFIDGWGYRRLVLPRRVRNELSAAGTKIAVRPIDDAIFPTLCAYDATAFGADRSALLTRMRGRLPSADLVAMREGRVVGFLLGRDGRSANQLGPLVAEDDDVARALLARALVGPAPPLYVDLADAKENIGRALADYGFAMQRPLTRMLYRRDARFDDPQRTYAVVGPEFG